MDHGCWSKAEGDEVCQRVELLADGGGDLEKAGSHAIEKVEQSAYNNKEERAMEIALESESRSYAA